MRTDRAKPAWVHEDDAGRSGGSVYLRGLSFLVCALVGSAATWAISHPSDFGLPDIVGEAGTGGRQVGFAAGGAGSLQCTAMGCMEDEKMRLRLETHAVFNRALSSMLELAETNADCRPAGPPWIQIGVPEGKASATRVDGGFLVCGSARCLYCPETDTLSSRFSILSGVWR